MKNAIIYGIISIKYLQNIFAGITTFYDNWNISNRLYSSVVNSSSFTPLISDYLSAEQLHIQTKHNLTP